MNTIEEKIVDEMIEMLIEDGWVKGHYVTDEGRCLSGALGQAIHRLVPDQRIHSELFARIYHVISDKAEIMDNMSIALWNDRRCTTFEDVMLALKKTKEHYGAVCGT